MKPRWPVKKKCPQLLLLYFLQFSCDGSKPAISAKLVSNRSYNLPALIQVTIKNNSDDIIHIYKPSHAFIYLWEIDIEYENKAIKRFRYRVAQDWVEYDPVRISGFGTFTDTINVFSPGDFYGDENRKKGCNPFRLAKRMRLIYTFAGHKKPSENLNGILVVEDTPHKYQTVSRSFITNWMGLEKIDLKQFEIDSVAASKVKGWLEQSTAQFDLPQFNCVTENE